MQIRTKIISSLEKVFLDSSIDQFKPLTFIRMMKNQRLSVQLAHTIEGDDAPIRIMPQLKINGALSDYARVRTVELVPVAMPVSVYDDNYLRTTPGLYPDWLQPLHYGAGISVMKDQLRALWVEFMPEGNLPAGTYETEIAFVDHMGEPIASEKITVEILNAELPEQEMLLTQWFHCDCLANYYHCEAWSERHWEIVENFAKTAKENGINLLLTPVFTPPLDTAIGGERTTNQLVDVTVTRANGADEYTFGFDKLDRWIDMCDRVGIKYFEISHLFTQWGAAHAPKVMATVDGEYKRIFGWDTEATGAEYTKFLRTFLPQFLDHMKQRGDDKRCHFHISDEPNGEQMAQYKASKAVVADLLEGYTIMDALSEYEFYKEGVVSTPIPSNNSIKPFIENNVPGLWTYYCCGQCIDVSNRLIAMPGWRNRSIGMQLYKYDIAGFLQWGYNFYNNMHSVNTVNPYADVSGEYWVPAGDPFSVYPAEDGTAYESTRIIVFHEALEDMRAMKLCESFYGKERVVAEMEAVFGEIRFDRCAKSAEMMLAVRARVDELIELALAEKK
ncbi:MAG: DUF4091 domain-containing protein [Ruminococcaceae bacterium]|nr:DUF4091 domain-containing protein [Oscillospiraceae bacterium]